MVIGRESADRYVPLVPAAGWYFPGRQDLETKWVKCASTMAERGTAGRGWVGIFLFPAARTTSHDGQKPLPVGGVHALCHGQRPSTVVDSVRAYDINESAESIIPTRDINVLKLPVTSRTDALRPTNKLLQLSESFENYWTFETSSM